MPSKSILEQKQAIVAALAEQLKNSPAGVVVNYQGITVDDDTKMRKALREAGVDYKVMKNSMTGRACDEVGLGDMKQYLYGLDQINLLSQALLGRQLYSQTTIDAAMTAIGQCETKTLAGQAMDEPLAALWTQINAQEQQAAALTN